MIQLHPDCLIFQTAAGENIPCSADLVSIELLGESAALLDPDLIRNASAAVLHYFKHELGREFVSVREFSLALEQVLRSFGLTIGSPGAAPQVRIAESDLRFVASNAGKGFELFFFPQLREELKRNLKDAPELVRFRGLRGCVKQLIGAQRWTQRCQVLSDQIVEYLRTSLTAEARPVSCSLLVL